MDVFAPVEITMPSLQHKHPVIVYDSKRYPGRSSEWFFHKENRISGHAVYRCVRCKSVNEKSKRSGVGSLGAPARIYIQNDHFMCDPDYPMGEHLCSFETDEECESSSVYAKRAILQANMDMRQNPEKPIAKYVKMLTLFENDNSNYAHLDEETRRRAQTILNQVGHGFHARKRGLMMNYALGKKQRQEQEQVESAVEIVPEASSSMDVLREQCEVSLTALSHQDDVVDVEATDDTELVDTKITVDSNVLTQVIVQPDPSDVPSSSSDSSKKLPCGCGDCERSFKSIASRTRHRSKIHPDMTFIDTEEDLYIFRKTLEAQGATDILADQQVPTLPFAVHWQLPQQTVTETYEEPTSMTTEETTVVFQSHVSDLLNAIHNMAYFLPPDTEVQTQMCNDLDAIIRKYAPLQTGNGEVVEETVEIQEVLLPTKSE